MTRKLPKVCPTCGREFPTNRAQKYCGPECNLARSFTAPKTHHYPPASECIIRRREIDADPKLRACMEAAGQPPEVIPLDARFARMRKVRARTEKAERAEKMSRSGRPRK